MATIYKRIETNRQTGEKMESRNWWISFMDGGRQVRRSLGVSQKVLAEIKKAEIEKNIERGLAGLPHQHIDSMAILKEYEANVIDNKSPSWRKRLLQLFRPFVRFVEERKLYNLTKITTNDIDEHLKVRSLHVGAKTRNEELRVIRQFFKFAQDRDYLVRNPASSVERRHAERPPIEILTPQELALIFKYAPVNLARFMRILLFTGLRDGEARHLQWQDIDLTPGKEHIRVRNTPTHRTKTRRDRIVPLSSETIEVLREIRASQQLKTPYVFASRKGEVKTHMRNVWLDLLERIRKKEGIVIDKGNHLTGLHLFRHTFATNALASGIDIRTVQEWLGHSSIVQTQRYTNLLPSHKQEQIHKLTIQIGNNDSD
ncbi:site-specific integrase [bacterium]|nr:site-specific integrase [bacterium]MBU1985558.1 site-specific integrase [bacterium]